LNLVEVGYSLDLANDMQGVISSNTVLHLLLWNVSQSPRVTSFARFDLEITSIHIAEAGLSLIVHEVEAIFGADSELNIESVKKPINLKVTSRVV
jgi:hypothetical protein